VTDEPPAARTVSDRTIREMTRHLEPDWRIETIERSSHGTDLVAVLDVGTPDGIRQVVLKAATADWADPETVRAEARLLSLVGRETTVPVPRVLGTCDEHEEYPAPFTLTSYVDGENYEGRAADLPVEIRERVFREAGRNLAALHDLGSLSHVGGIGVRDDGLAVLDTEDSPASDDFHDWLLASYEDTLDDLLEGGYFPHLADDPRRFADLVPDLRRYLRETVPTLPEPDPPTYCHKDYRYGNLLLDPETGETRAMLDWGLVMAAPPAFNLASTESLLALDSDGPARTDRLRRTLRSAYAATRDDWTFGEDTCEHLRVYHLACRLDAMACLPLWYPDEDEREERAAAHRAFVCEYR